MSNLTDPPILFGLDLISEIEPLISSIRTGLVTNHSGLSLNFESNIEILRKKTNLLCLFGPEHGIWGDHHDAIKVLSHVDPISGLKVHSLYGENTRPTKEMLENIDALIFDIQDIGTRFQTYITTLCECMKSCSELKKKFIVLDRPNPLGGEMTEGPILKEKFKSFFGPAKIPIRHGLTVGELALLLKKEHSMEIDLQIVKMKGWKRKMMWRDTGRFWIQTSPNMPTAETAIVQPGTCFLEGTNVAEGRGTSKPFELFGAPWLEPNYLIKELDKQSIKEVKFLPVYFQPTYGKQLGEHCKGVQIALKNHSAQKSVEAGWAIIKALKASFPKEFAANEFLDLLLGEDSNTILNEDYTLVIERWRKEALDFKAKASQFYLYD